MAITVIPSYKIRSEMEDIYDESFYWDYDASGILILYLKLFPNLAISVINGVPITLVFRNPKIEKYNITLYIHDVIDAPFYISKFFHPKQDNLQNDGPLGLTEYASYFRTNTKIRIAIFDETLKNIYTEDTEVFLPSISLQSWYRGVMSSPNTPSFDYDNPQENESTGYIIRVNPIKYASSFSYTNLETKKEWGEEPYVVSSNKNADHFTVSNYTETGSLGYLQEQNIKEVLSSYFVPDSQLFSSPYLRNKTELTDIVFGADGYLVLIESKTAASYDGSEKKVRGKSRAITQSINKACTQLIRAQNILEENPNDIVDIRLIEHFSFVEIFIKICLVSDTLVIDTEFLRQLLSAYNKDDLPIIMSLDTFYEILFSLHNPSKIVETLFNIKSFLYEQGGLPILAGIKK